MAANDEKLLSIENLKVSFKTYMGEVQAVRGVTYSINKGEILAVVGESGCGKSVTAQSILRIVEEPGKITAGSITLDGIDILSLSEKQMRSVRGKDVSMIFQDPMTSLNPTKRVGKQIVESILKHQSVSKKEAENKAVRMLSMVGIPNSEKRMKQYPFEFSGGMRQRVMIAIALCCEPKLLIADEPTTALDVTIQSQIIDLMVELQHKLNTSILLITHDLGVVADIADKVAIMYGGVIVEEGSVNDIFYSSKHPYTWGLLNSVPKLSAKKKERLIPIEGAPPDLLNPPEGCPFETRCNYAMKICSRVFPDRFDINDGHYTHCWLMHERAQMQNVQSGGIVK